VISELNLFTTFTVVLANFGDEARLGAALDRFQGLVITESTIPVRNVPDEVSGHFTPFPITEEITCLELVRFVQRMRFPGTSVNRA
jgi:hypothetical protein